MSGERQEIHVRILDSREARASLEGVIPRHGREEMTVGEILAIVALVIVGVELWIARQARIVRKDVQARRTTMEAAGRPQEEHLRRQGRRIRRGSRRVC